MAVTGDSDDNRFHERFSSALSDIGENRLQLAQETDVEHIDGAAVGHLAAGQQGLAANGRLDEFRNDRKASRGERNTLVLYSGVSAGGC